MQFKLPELGEGVHEGELVKWRVKPGDAVKYDQPLCEIMTDKATVEIPSAFQGKVGELHAKEGEVVKVGQLLLSFEGAGAAQATSAPAAPKEAPSASVAKPSAAPQAAAHAAPAPAAMAAPAGSPATRVLAAPSTRRLAREQGVELGRVQGSGPHGRILKEDVESWFSGGRAVAAGAARPALSRVAPSGGEERIPLRGLRKKIAEKMRLSKDHAAHFTYVEEADATELVRLRNMAKELGGKTGVKVTYLPFVMKAMVAALRSAPEFQAINSTIDDERGEIVVKHDFNIGLSIQTEDGLTAPVIKDVAHKSVLELAREIQQVVERARAKRLTREDFEGGTITLTNAGSIGGLFATPIINYPEVAILGFNKIARKPVVVEVDGREQIVIRDWTYFSISLDHRVVDGAIAAEFMKVFIRFIENPSLLLLESF
ncbi:MAG: 2-oxo acid dehydrogenase subunit E2 [Oligoflexia bacterium]|nr:2-oxo acid dehydrogenase subunit E2 [Oligoflexia bacterium]